MAKDDFVYTTYIKTTPKRIWDALTKPEFTRQYWSYENISDWKKGSEWSHRRPGKDDEMLLLGKVLESRPPKKLVLTWSACDGGKEKASRVTFDIKPLADGIVCLHVVHSHFPRGSKMRGKVAMGWPLVLSNMKSFLEVGKAFDIWALKNCS